ncbi:cytochrome P450 3A29-like [Haliotis rufescens]|uniref:cytochrome P450 3A29-like n=1 Tax=Haliotis rufescens TaxID=6454 RepID=UPI001EB0143F|nr:cytochrome P450 3A29-like [Haliotis rufescens]
MEILGLVDVPLYLLLAVAAAVLLYIHGTWNFNYFKNRGIRGPTPYPLLGNSTSFSFFHKFKEWNRQYGNIYGIFLGRKPALVISDLDILKEVFVKSFNTFRNRMKFTLVPFPFNLGVFFLEDSHWKRVRGIITPSFSGGKLRKMCAAINDCATTLSANFSKVVGKKEGVIMKEYFGAYTMDVISRTAFGIKVDSQNDFNNPFVAHAKLMFTNSKPRRLLPLLARFCPPLVWIILKLGGALFPKSMMNFFQTNITEMIKQRQSDTKERREQRVDFLQLLVDAEIEADRDENGHAANGQIPEKHSVRRLTTDEIVGQGILFFIAGYETTASTLNFASYSLAMNPGTQEKAYNEITEMLGNEEPNYDNIGKLKYLDKVITETLRLYPPVIALNRRASETIEIKGLTIPEGQTVFVPTFALQRDPQLFKDPESFKPERHDEKSNPLSFLAFGYGPRICIGMRLALVEVKIALVHVLRTVKFERMPDTQEVLTFKLSNILQTEKDIRLKLSPRC